MDFCQLTFRNPFVSEFIRCIILICWLKAQAGAGTDQSLWFSHSKWQPRPLNPSQICFLGARKLETSVMVDHYDMKVVLPPFDQWMQLASDQYLIMETEYHFPSGTDRCHLGPQSREKKLWRETKEKKKHVKCAQLTQIASRSFADNKHKVVFSVPSCTSELSWLFFYL